jgi:hypothetical protein
MEELLLKTTTNKWGFQKLENLMRKKSEFESEESTLTKPKLKSN